MAARLNPRNKSRKRICAEPIRAEVTCYHGNKTVMFSLTITFAKQNPHYKPHDANSMHANE